MEVSWKAHLWKTHENKWTTTGHSSPSVDFVELGRLRHLRVGARVAGDAIPDLGDEGRPDLEGKISVSVGRQTYGEW